MSLGPLPIDPNESGIFGFDWEPYLGSDTISTSTWVLPAGLTQAAATNTTTTTQIRVGTSGTAGTQYLMVNRITTAAGATYDRTMLLQVIER